VYYLERVERTHARLLKSTPLRLVATHIIFPNSICFT
jgi:hypothetical protein